MGVVLYILLSGKVPFPGDSNKEIIENVLNSDRLASDGLLENVKRDANACEESLK